MKYRQLESLRVSEIGFGAWGIGGVTEGATSYGPTNDNVSKAAIRTALDNGINFFDTSNVYGDGHSEELIGEIIEERKCRTSVVIATKGGLSKHHGRQDLSPESLKKSLESSLRRLKTDYVDLYQLHSPDLQEVKTWKAYETLCQLKQAGIVKEIGFSLKSPSEGLTAIEIGFKILQINFSMMDQRAWDCDLLSLAKEKNVRLISRTPFCFGFLTGKITNLDFSPNDHRSVWSPTQLKTWLDGSIIFKQLNEGLNQKNKNCNRRLSELALQFCLFPKSIATVIPGMMSPQEVTENTRTADWPDLTIAEIIAVRHIYKVNSGFFSK